MKDAVDGFFFTLWGSGHRKDAKRFFLVILLYKKYGRQWPTLAMAIEMALQFSESVTPFRFYGPRGDIYLSIKVFYGIFYLKYK